MNFFLPPYGKHHIIALASLTFFIAIGLLFYWKTVIDQPAGQPLPSTSTNIQADNLRQDESIQAGYALAQLNTPQTAWADQKIVVLDIRPTTDFQQAHLQGAMSVPIDWLDKASLDPQSKVIVYSTSNQELDKAKFILSGKSVAHIYLLNETIENLEGRGHLISRP